MSAQPRPAHGGECGLRILREIVRPENHCGVDTRALRSDGCASTGESLRLRVVCLDSAAVAME